MLAAIRLRGSANIRQEVRRTCEMLKLTRQNTLVVVPDTPSMRGMLRKIESHITWGEADESTVKAAGEGRVRHLKPPAKGFRSLKQAWPPGDLGYRGDKINELVRRML